MSLISKLQCDGCGRKPRLMEWLRGELTNTGYPEWRHPGIAFMAAGCPITHSNRAKAERLFHALFGRPLPDEPSYLCPDCQTWAEEQLPALSRQDTGPDLRSHPSAHHYFG